LRAASWVIAGWRSSDALSRRRRTIGSCISRTRDTYHASLLHLFFATFRITRLSSGGLLGERDRRALRPRRRSAAAGKDSSYEGLRSDKASPPRRSSLLGMHDEFYDDIQLQILSIPDLRPPAGAQCAGGAPDRRAASMRPT
jgi:hypothetical protein